MWPKAILLFCFVSFDLQLSVCLSWPPGTAADTFWRIEEAP